MRLALGDVMDIVQLAMILVPLLGAAAGYLIEGVTGATSGFVIPIGLLSGLLWWRGSSGAADDALRPLRQKRSS
jgi:hypothetical protein